MEMKVIDTPASVPSSAARGVTLRIQCAMNPPAIRMKLWKNTHTSPASQAWIGTLVLSLIGSRITQVTMNMCGTLMPDGSAQTSLRPSGISVPHMFIVTLVIMLPIKLKTNDPIQAWEAGLVWVFFQSFILMAGGFIAHWIRKVTPRAALLGTLAGVSITFISMTPALQIYMTPVIGLTCLAVIAVNWLGGFKYPGGIPAGLVAIAVGMLIAWGSNLFGLNYGGLSGKGVLDAFSNFGFNVPIPRSEEHT